MKKIIIAATLLLAVTSQASKYKCQTSDNDSISKTAQIFEISSKPTLVGTINDGVNVTLSKVNRRLHLVIESKTTDTYSISSGLGKISFLQIGANPVSETDNKGFVFCEAVR